MTELNVGLSLENAFSKYSKFGGVTGVLDGAQILIKIIKIKILNDFEFINLLINC